MASAPELPDNANLVVYCRVLWKYRRLIVSLCILSILASLFYSLITPKVYTAQATILPPIEMGLGSGGPIALALGAMAGRGAGEGSYGQPQAGGGMLAVQPMTPYRDTYIAILRSRTMRQEVVDYFRKTSGPAVGSLIGKVEVGVSEEGVISVTAESRDPKLAADVANHYFENLSALLGRRAKDTANIQLAYYERQLSRTTKDLKEAQEELIEFQEKNRYIALDPTTKTAIASGAMQAGSVMALEMELTLKRMYLTEQHPEMIALNRRIYEAKRLLSHQLYGEAQPLPPESPGSPARKEYFVPTARMTPLQFKLADVYRNLRFREVVATYILQNIETLKYTGEHPAAIHVDWLDRALPPGQPSRPKVMSSVLAALVSSLVIGLLLAFFLEYLSRIKAFEAKAWRNETAQ